MNLLPSEIRAYIIEFLDNSDYLSAILSSKLLHSSVSSLDKQARRDVETCVKYRKYAYLNSFDEEDILVYATIYGQDNIKKFYSSYLRETELLFATANLETLKAVDIDSLDAGSGDFRVTTECMKAAVRYNHKDVISYFFDAYPRLKNICGLQCMATALRYNRNEIYDYLRYEGLSIIYPLQESTIFDILTFDPKIVKEIEAENDSSQNLIFYNYLKNDGNLNFNHNSVKNLKILQPREDAGRFILLKAIEVDYLPVIIWTLNEYRFLCKAYDISRPLREKFVFHLLDSFPEGNYPERLLKKLVILLESQPELIIKVINRYPSLRNLLDERLVKFAVKHPNNSNLIYHLYNLKERTFEETVSIVLITKNKETVSIVLITKNKEMEEYLLSKLGTDKRSIVHAIFSNEKITDFEKRKFLYQYLDTIPTNELLDYVIVKDKK